MAGTVAVQLYTVRSVLARDPVATVRRLAELGYGAVEGFDLVTLADGYAAALGATGLPMPSAHVSLVGADVEAALGAAQRLGVTTLIEPWVDPARWATRETIQAIAAELAVAADRAADAGIAVGYHNHAHELERRIGGVTALEVLADVLDARVVLEVDTYWAEIGGEAAPALLRRLGERVRYLHVKDGPRVRDVRTQTAVGSGALPVADIVAAAPAAGLVVELDEYAGDVFDALAESRHYLASIGR